MANGPKLFCMSFFREIEENEKTIYQRNCGPGEEAHGVVPPLVAPWDPHDASCTPFPWLQCPRICIDLKSTMYSHDIAKS
jgi:hypothetical protein